MRRAIWMSLAWIVTRLAWMASRLLSSKRWTRYASAASCSATTACDCQREPSGKRVPAAMSLATSRTSRWKGHEDHHIAKLPAVLRVTAKVGAVRPAILRRRILDAHDPAVEGAEDFDQQHLVP